VLLKNRKLITEQLCSSATNFGLLFIPSISLVDQEFTIIGFYYFFLVLINSFSSALFHIKNNIDIFVSNSEQIHMDNRAQYLFITPLILIPIVSIFYWYLNVKVLELFIITVSMYLQGYIELIRRQNIQVNRLELPLKVAYIGLVLKLAAALVANSMYEYFVTILFVMMLQFAYIYLNSNIKICILNISGLLERLSFCVPLLLNLPTGNLWGRAPLFILYEFIGVSAASNYLKVASVFNLANPLIELIPNYIAPRLSSIYLSDKVEYKDTIKKLLIILIGIYLLGFFVAILIYFLLFSLIDSYDGITFYNTILTWGPMVFVFVFPVYSLHQRCHNDLHKPIYLINLNMLLFLSLQFSFYYTNILSYNLVMFSLSIQVMISSLYMAWTIIYERIK